MGTDTVGGVAVTRIGTSFGVVGGISADLPAKRAAVQAGVLAVCMDSDTVGVVGTRLGVISGFLFSSSSVTNVCLEGVVGSMLDGTTFSGALFCELFSSSRAFAALVLEESAVT